MLVVLAGLVWVVGPKLVTGPLLWLAAEPVWAVVIAAGVVATWLFATSTDRASKVQKAQAARKAGKSSGRSSEQDDERLVRMQAQSQRNSRAAGIVVAAGLLVAGLGFTLLPYAKASALAGTYERIDTVPGYQDRAPFVVAEQLSNRDLDEVIGDRVGVHAVQSADQPNQYTTLVVRRGWFQGYEAVQTIRPPLVGAGSESSSACKFQPEHGLRLGGAVPSNNLARAIAFQRPFALFDEDDAYGFCDGDEPVVVVPLKRLGGIWPVVVEKPAGAAVYRGGELTILDSDEIDESIIGPTYPRSIAAQQREASLASGTFMDWLFKRAGYDTAGDTSDSEEESEAPDEPNRSNAVDFSLVDTDGAGEFVTALTPVGASESVVAAGHVSFRQTSRELNPYRISRYEPALPALSTSENRLRSDLSDLPGWASGMRVMEITPSSDGTYVASIGQNQVVTYRARIGVDGAVQLLQRDAQAPAAEAPTPSERDLEDMSSSEIAEQIRILTEELARRAEHE